jgi:ureidoacrylate peracid hydrolase
MHKATIRQEIIDRVLARRGRFHWFDQLDPSRTALVVIDMQGTFCEPGGPAEVPGSRGIVGPINALTRRLRTLRIPVIWILHANTHLAGRSDWEIFFNNVVAGEVRQRTLESLAPGRQTVWSELETTQDDIVITKNRYSALSVGSSSLERILRNLNIDTTARDAMMLDFKVVMVEDCCAALSDEEHRATLETIIQQFGDVMKSDEVVARLNVHDHV